MMWCILTAIYHFFSIFQTRTNDFFLFECSLQFLLVNKTILKIFASFNKMFKIIIFHLYVYYLVPNRDFFGYDNVVAINVKKESVNCAATPKIITDLFEEKNRQFQHLETLSMHLKKLFQLHRNRAESRRLSFLICLLLHKIIS